MIKLRIDQRPDNKGLVIVEVNDETRGAFTLENEDELELLKTVCEKGGIVYDIHTNSPTSS